MAECPVMSAPLTMNSWRQPLTHLEIGRVSQCSAMCGSTVPARAEISRRRSALPRRRRRIIWLLSRRPASSFRLPPATWQRAASGCAIPSCLPVSLNFTRRSAANSASASSEPEQREARKEKVSPFATRPHSLPVSDSASRYLQTMPPQRSYGGRKSKGDRQPLISRVPSPIADAVRDRAEERGMSLSDYIASVLARDVGLATLAPQASIRHDEELPINQVA